MEREEERPKVRAVGQWTFRILEVEKDSVEERAVELVSG